MTGIWAVAGRQVPAKLLSIPALAKTGIRLNVAAPNQIRVYDIAFDGCANGHKLKSMKIRNEFSKDLCIDVAGFITK
jgi:hypothetical protein